MDNISFPQRLAEERRARGYTQKQVAEALGISDRTYSKWETGENEMDVSSLCRLAEFYGVSPAVFFPSETLHPEGVRKALAPLGPNDAAQSWFRIHIDAIRGMGDAMSGWFSSKPRQAAYGKPLPGLEAPPVPQDLEGTPNADAALCAFDCPDLMGLVAAGRDANLSLLMLPHEEKYAWMESEAERLEALFRVLSLPGAMKSLRFLMSQPLENLFSVPYLAERAGISPEEADAFLQAAGEQLFCVPQPLRREGRDETLYRSRFRAELAGILTLAKLLLPFRRGDPQRYGHMGGTGGRLPEKGENT